MYYSFEYLSFGGAELFTAVLLPDKEGRFPAVIIRNPYVDAYETKPEEEICEQHLEENKRWLQGGYAVVYQHCRGRGKSSGDCVPYIYEREDGLFLQEWVRQQSFYNGEIILNGGSYLSSVHFVTAPFADDIKGAILEVQDCERYNCNYRNGFYKVGLHGGWYMDMYKKKSIRKKDYTTDSFRTLPLSELSKIAFSESAEDFDQILKHPKRDDPFWRTRFGGGEARDAIKSAGIPILLTTGFYDIYTGGVFDMWNGLDEKTKSLCALVVHPYDHGGTGGGQPIVFENGVLSQKVHAYKKLWADHVIKGTNPPFEPGKITYYKLFGDKWCTDSFYDAEELVEMKFGEGERSYKYNPYSPATVFNGGLSQNFGGNAWQEKPNSRYDVLSFYTEEFSEDTFIKGKIKAKMKVSSDCEDTCFYMRLSLCKEEGDYGLRDDITQISNFDPQYVPNTKLDITFSFDEHAFVIKKGEKLRVDVSSSAFPHFVAHTNQRGLFSEQKYAKTAFNTLYLDDCRIELPIKNNS